MKRSSAIGLLLLFSWTLCGASFSLPERFHPKAIYQRFCERWLGTEPARGPERLDQDFLLKLGGYTESLINWDITGFYEGEKLFLKPDAPLSDMARLLHIEATYNKTGRMITVPGGTLEFSATDNGIYVWQMGFPIQRNPAIIDLVDRIRQYGLMDQFFFPNPNLLDDVMVQLSSANLLKREVKRISLERAIEDGTYDVFMFSEIPGHDSGVKAIETLVKARQIEWVALEAFTLQMQSLFDAYIYSSADSDEGNKALEEILKYIEDWKSIYPELEANGANYYLELLKTCRAFGVRVVGIEPTPQNSPYKLKTRNRLWALDTPRSGVGIVYGQRKHFEDDLGANYQDFLSQDRNPVFVRF